MKSTNNNSTLELNGYHYFVGPYQSIEIMEQLISAQTLLYIYIFMYLYMVLYHRIIIRVSLTEHLSQLVYEAW